MNMLKFLVLHTVLVTLLVLAGAQLTASAQTEDNTLNTTLDVTISAQGIQFQPKVTCRQMSVTISSPSGEMFTKTFPGSGYGFVSLSQLNSSAIEDGVYNYETVLETAGETGRSMVLSGYFRVLDGQAITPRKTSSGSDNELSGSQEHINETLYVTGNLGIGPDMEDETIMFLETLLMQDNNCMISFDDTSTSIGFPNTDWSLKANDMTNGGADYFAILDDTNATVPFTIQADAPTNTLYLDSQGEVGIGTSTPSSNLHIWDTGSAYFKLERSTGAQVEMYAGPSIGYLGTRDNYAFRFITNSIYRMTIDTDGDVGIGLTSPSYKLHITGGAYCDGSNWVDASSREYKENIADLSHKDALDTLKNLKPVTFNYKTRKDDASVGFIAEDVPELVATKDRKGLSTMDIVAVLTRVVQQQQQRLEEQNKLIRELQKEIKKK